MSLLRLNEGESRQVQALDGAGRAAPHEIWRISPYRLPPASVTVDLLAAQPHSSGCSGSRVAIELSKRIAYFSVLYQEYGGAACATDLAIRAYSITDFHHTALLQGLSTARYVTWCGQSRLSFLVVHANLMLFYEVDDTPILYTVPGRSTALLCCYEPSMMWELYGRCI